MDTCVSVGAGTFPFYGKTKQKLYHKIKVRRRCSVLCNTVSCQHLLKPCHVHGDPLSQNGIFSMEGCPWDKISDECRDLLKQVGVNVTEATHGFKPLLSFPYRGCCNAVACCGPASAHFAPRRTERTCDMSSAVSSRLIDIETCFFRLRSPTFVGPVTSMATPCSPGGKGHSGTHDARRTLLRHRVASDTSFLLCIARKRANSD